MQVNFHKLLHPDWRYILITLSVLVVLSITQSVLAMDITLFFDILMLDVITLLPSIIGYPLHKFFQKKNPVLGEKILNLVALLQLVFVTYLVSLFWFLF